jgi:hypothetical protein
MYSVDKKIVPRLSDVGRGIFACYSVLVGLLEIDSEMDLF